MDERQQIGSASRIGIRDLMRELFYIYADMVDAAGGPTETRLPYVHYHQQEFLDRLEQSRAMCDAVRMTVIRLVDFYDTHGQCIQAAVRAQGGVKLAVERGTDFDQRSMSAMGAMSLFVDTQIMADPVLLMYSARDGDGDIHRYAPFLVAWGLAHAETILQLRPLVEAPLKVIPLIIHEPDRLISDPALPRIRSTFDDWVEKSVGEPTSPWRRAYESLFSSYLTRVRSDGYKPVFADHNLHRAVERAQAVVNLRAHIARCDSLHAEPMLTSELPTEIYQKYSSLLSTDLEQYGNLTKEGAIALRALQQQEFRWLRGVPIASIPTLLTYQENKAFREKLEEQVKLVQRASLHDLSDATIQVSHALALMVAEHDKTMAELADKYKPKNVSLRDASALGVLIAGGVSAFAPALGHPLNAAAGLLLGGATALGVAGSAAKDWFKNKREEQVEREIARRSLFGVIAKIRPPT